MVVRGEGGYGEWKGDWKGTNSSCNKSWDVIQHGDYLIILYCTSEKAARE